MLEMPKKNEKTLFFEETFLERRILNRILFSAPPFEKTPLSPFTVQAPVGCQIKTYHDDYLDS